VEVARSSVVWLSRVLTKIVRRIFGPKTDQLKENGEYCIRENFVIYSAVSRFQPVFF
jgi:hypothetical protein